MSSPQREVCEIPSGPISIQAIFSYIEKYLARYLAVSPKEFTTKCRSFFENILKDIILCSPCNNIKSFTKIFY